MRVSKDFYLTGFHDPETCMKVAEFCRNEVRESGRPYNARALLAKRLHSFICKNYPIAKNSPARIHAEWGKDPETFISWVLGHVKGDTVPRIERKDKRGHFSPENLQVK